MHLQVNPNTKSCCFSSCTEAPTPCERALLITTLVISILALAIAVLGTLSLLDIIPPTNVLSYTAILGPYGCPALLSISALTSLLLLFVLAKRTPKKEEGAFYPFPQFPEGTNFNAPTTINIHYTNSPPQKAPTEVTPSTSQPPKAPPKENNEVK